MMRVLKGLLVTVLLLLAGVLMVIRTTYADRTDDYLKAEMAKRHIPGLSVAVVQDGKVTKAQGYGTASVELAVPATADTVYPIGSISKQFTAAGILLLAQDKKLGLDDAIGKYISHLPQTWQPITLRQLLNQTSGVPDWIPDPNQNPLLKTYTLAELVKHAAVKPLAFVPGTRFEYCNMNYSLLAGVIEKVTGKPYGEFLKARLFDPLGMNSTGVYDPEAVVPNRAVGYSRVGGQIFNNVLLYDPSIPAGAGGLQSTVNDLVKWDAALTAGTVLSAPMQMLAKTPPTLPKGEPTFYGMGWMCQSQHGHRLLWHNGAIPGAMGVIERFPDDRLTVIVLSNMMPLDRFDDNFLPLGLGVAALSLPALAPKQESPPSAGIPDTDPQTAAILKTVSAQIAAGKLDFSLFAPSFQAVLTPDAIAPAHALLAPLGPLTSLVLLKRAPDGSALYQARYGKTVVRWLIVVDKDYKITGLRPLPE